MRSILILFVLFLGIFTISVISKKTTTKVCQTNNDCKFCSGESCNITTKKCEKITENICGCAECDEKNKKCLEFEEPDCDDGIHCNGKEYFNEDKCKCSREPSPCGCEKECNEELKECQQCYPDFDPSCIRCQQNKTRNHKGSTCSENDDCESDTFCQVVSRCIGHECKISRPRCSCVQKCSENEKSCSPLPCSIDNDCKKRCTFCSGDAFCKDGQCSLTDRCSVSEICLENEKKCVPSNSLVDSSLLLQQQENINTDTTSPQPSPSTSAGILVFAIAGGLTVLVFIVGFVYIAYTRM